MSILAYIVLMIIATIMIVCAIAINDKYNIIISIVLLIIVVIESSFIVAYILS